MELEEEECIRYFVECEYHCLPYKSFSFPETSILRSKAEGEKYFQFVFISWFVEVSMTAECMMTFTHTNEVEKLQLTVFFSFFEGFHIYLHLTTST